MGYKKMKQQLMDRLKENYEDYRATLMLKDRDQLINEAQEIAYANNTFEYMTELHEYDKEDLEHYLQFQNPLEVGIYHWEWGEARMYSDYANLPDFMNDFVNESDLDRFPLISDAKPPVEPLRKFLDVDIEESLKQIMGQITVHNTKDLQSAFNTMRKGLDSDDSTKRNYIMLFTQEGLECLNERDMMISGSRDYNICQYYHDQTKEPVLAYIVELTGTSQKGLKGNLYEQDHRCMAEFAERFSSPYEGNILTFDTGRAVRVYLGNCNDIDTNRIEAEHGNITEVHIEPEDESVVHSALYHEHKRRERFPKGHLKIHVQELADKRIQAEADRITTALQDGQCNSAVGSLVCEVKVSENFLALSNSHDVKRLMNKILYPHHLKDAENGWQEGKSSIVFFRPGKQLQSEKSSIKAKLTSPSAPGDHLPAAKKTKQEMDR